MFHKCKIFNLGLFYSLCLETVQNNKVRLTKMALLVLNTYDFLVMQLYLKKVC